MKINEFNQPKKIDESLAGAMFGEVPMAALKGLISGKGGKHQLAQDIFLRDFYQDAITSLDNGIRSGYVDKNKAYNPNPTTNANANANANADDNQANAQPQQFMGKAAPDVRPATKPADPLSAPTLAQPGKTVNTRVGTTSTPGSITTGGPGALTRSGTSAPATKPGTPAAPGSITTGGPEAPARPGTPAATAPATRPSTPALATGAAAPKPATPSQPNPNDQQYKWAPKGMKITPNTPLSSLGATGKLAESTYHNLNNIFESVISEMEGGNDATISITDHMIEWFGQYMDGANWESKKAAIIPQIKKIQDTYSSDKGKAAIKNLARLAYSITGQRGGGMPAGARNAVQNTTGIANPAGTQPTGKIPPEQLKAELAAMRPQDRDKLIQDVQKATR